MELAELSEVFTTHLKTFINNEKKYDVFIDRFHLVNFRKKFHEGD